MKFIELLLTGILLIVSGFAAVSGTQGVWEILSSSSPDQQQLVAPIGAVSVGYVFFIGISASIIHYWIQQRRERRFKSS